MKWSRPQGLLSDRKWIFLISIALILETVWLLAELNLISLPFLNRHKNSKGLVEAGYIIKAQSDIKKRGANSLIWEATKQDDILYYRDSVLTLSESTATLYLKDQTELQMSENTLVTLEEPEESSNAEIRLRFSKGDLTARNPFAKTQIESKDWVVNLEKGAEVAMRKTDQAYEFEVLTGQASLQTDKGTEALGDSKIIKINDSQQIESIDKSLNLKWSEPKPERIYTFEDKAIVPLQWQGSANAIRIERQGQVSENKALKAEQQNTDVELPVGSYQIRLEDQNGISNAKTIEVWQAPKIILKKPLPRDRISLDSPLEFVWSADSKVKSYQLKLSNGQIYNSEDNAKAIKFDQEQDVIWKIEAVDEQGFVIPSLYESKVYLRSNTLAAPKLKTPKLIEEIEPQQQDSDEPDLKQQKNKQPNSKILEIKEPFSAIKKSMSEKVYVKLLFKLFSQTAQAQVLRKKQVIFEWEPVSGANQYIIEISSDPEFKKPEVIETLSSTRYVWKKYDARKKYYWRVASGHSNCQMGLFSEPTELQVIVEKIQPEPKPKEVQAEASAPIAPTQTPVPVAAEETKPTETKQELERNIYEGIASWQLGYMGTYKSASVPGDQNSRIELGGLAALGADFQFKKQIASENLVLGQFSVSSQKWKPNLQNTNSTQPELSMLEIESSLRYANIKSTWQYGLAVHQSFYAERELQNIKNVNVLLVGSEIAKYFNSNFHAMAGYLVGSKISETKFSIKYNNYFGETKNYYYGVYLTGYSQSGTYGSGQQSQLQLAIGLSGF
jgi:hypothetical protein